MKYHHSSIAAFLLFALPLQAQLSQDEFRKPPLQARPSALWSWMNGHVDHAQITRELEEMKAKGMRGAIIWDVGSLRDPEKIIPAGPEFLGPESIKSIHHAMDEAERLGLELGLFASSSWNAGGSWITPQDGSKAIVSSELKVVGPRNFSGTLPLPAKTTEHHESIHGTTASSATSALNPGNVSPAPMSRTGSTKTRLCCRPVCWAR